MRTIFILIAMLAISALALASNVFAQAACLPLESVIETTAKFHEKLAWKGTVPLDETSPAAMMLFQSPAGTWTLVAVHGVMACVVGVGVNGSPVIVGQDA